MSILNYASMSKEDIIEELIVLQGNHARLSTEGGKKDQKIADLEAIFMKIMDAAKDTDSVPTWLIDDVIASVSTLQKCPNCKSPDTRPENGVCEYCGY